MTDPIEAGLADAGYASKANFEAEIDLGFSLLIATGGGSKIAKQDTTDTDERDRERIDVLSRVESGQYTLTQAADILGISHGWVSTLRARYLAHGDLASDSMLAWRAMGEKLTEPENREFYKKRGWLIEGSYAHIKTHRGTSSFSRHGLAACRAEWNLINIAGNLRKLHKKRLETPRTPPTGPLNALGRSIRPIWARHRAISRPVALKQRPNTRNATPEPLHPPHQVKRRSLQRGMASVDGGPLVDANDVLAWATIAGATANGLDAEVGSLTPGKQADIIMLRTDRINVTPLNDPATAVVTGMDMSNVDSVFIAGRAMKRNGKLLHVDWPATMAMVSETRDQVMRKSGFKAPSI